MDESGAVTSQPAGLVSPDSQFIEGNFLQLNPAVRLW